MNWNVVGGILAAVITCGGAVWAALIARGIKADVRQREADRRELRMQRRQIQDLQADVLTLRRFAFSLRAKLAGADIETPDMPRLRSEEWE